MNLYELESFARRLDEFERAFVRSGRPKKYLLEIVSVRNVLQEMIAEERKKANG